MRYLTSRGNVRCGMHLSGICLVGEMSIGDVSSRGSVHRGCACSGKCLSGKCPSGMCSGIILNGLQRVTINFFLKKNINIHFFINLTVTRGNALQISPNNARLREIVR